MVPQYFMRSFLNMEVDIHQAFHPVCGWRRPFSVRAGRHTNE